MFENCLLLAGVMILGMASPGPDFLLVFKNACSGSKAFGFGTAVGITLGIVVHLVYCVLGLGLIISKSIIAYNIVKYCGACYLIYIGVKSLLAKTEAVFDITVSEGQGKGRTFGRGLGEGFLCNALNPKATVFFVSVISQFFGPSVPLGEMAVYCSLIIGLNTAYWLLMVSLLQRDVVQNLVASARSGMDRVFGTFLIFMGMRVAFSD